MRWWVVLTVMVGCTGPTIDETGDSDRHADTDIDTDTDDPDTVPDPEDVDSDGFPAGEDCDDLDPSVYPGAPEILWNGVDDDCDGRVDADGRFEGSGQVTFIATVEGVTSRWVLTCPVVVERARVRVTFEITCEPPRGDALARQVMGEQFTISERANVAEEAVLNGDIVYESSDGWSVDGSGQLRFVTADRVDGGVSMRSVFARSTGSFSADFED